MPEKYKQACKACWEAWKEFAKELVTDTDSYDYIVNNERMFIKYFHTFSGAKPKKIRVGTVKKLIKDCLGNPAGTVGVCYEVYTIDGIGGASFIFPNGSHDGFCVGHKNRSSEIEIFFEPDFEDLEPSVLNYKFTNVMQLSRDFDKGYFNKAFMR